VLYQSRQDALERARETSRNLGLIAERDIERNFELYDLSLQAVIQGLQRTDVMAAPPGLAARCAVRPRDDRPVSRLDA
jgi:hypothetical protein